ncbi:hypothetical protein HRH25_09865 [Flavisolibacter sp. BT320]|nr:hypothetical protein [Flavisolibacter longurius]
MPFYSGEQENVIPVYCSSIYFQGYVAQGYKSFFKKEFSHYFFIADDLILNPLINEKNYRQYLKLGASTCFIPRLSALAENRKFWPVNFHALLYEVESPGVEAKSQIPSYAEALELLQRHGLENKPLTVNQVWKKPESVKEWWNTVKRDHRYLGRALRAKLGKDEKHPAYPLVRSYSDIFVVSADAIKKFAHYCGVMAATRLFVELAIPTSMVFAAKEIVTEKDLELQGSALWTEEDFTLLNKYQNNLHSLLEDFPEGRLYIHPVKLSQWKTTH